jgi:HSP20 family protein
VGQIMMARLLGGKPFDELQRLTDTVDRLADRWRSGATWMASPLHTAVSRADDGYRVRIPLPGIAPEHVTVDVTGRTVQVRALEPNGDTFVTRHEEVLTLPASVDADRIGATFRHGLLELTLPARDEVKPRRIEIASEASKQLASAA